MQRLELELRALGELLLDLIVEKDGDSAERVMREHVRASRRALLDGLAARDGADGAGSTSVTA